MGIISMYELAEGYFPESPAKVGDEKHSTKGRFCAEDKFGFQLSQTSRME